jgi:anti-sigma regulatory factor (Ser/Thr protein kinase)
MKGPRRLELSVPGTVNHLDTIRDFIREHSGAAGFSGDTIDAIVLAVDEAVANVVEHAYHDSPLPVEAQVIRLLIEIDARCFLIRLSDRGMPFDPTTAPTVDIDRHLAEFRSDGVGIHFMRQLMDELRYAPDPAGGNVLEMVKYF